ncbi:MAG TPA: acyl carrier protein, partial [Flavobacteriales bacterium]|nr:acyl carrier protein [Flavobacteriales bacterium]
MDTIADFTSKLEKEFEDLEPGTLKPDTNMRQLPNWSSMHALIIIALIDTEYDVKITGEDLRKCNTVSDVYEVTKSRVA